jgi:hypothetical protein
MFQPTSIAIAANEAHYAVGYNEGGVGMHGFRLSNPQLDMPVGHPDPFSAWSFVTTDGRTIYWANTGGLSKTSFVIASDPSGGKFAPFSSGQRICLQNLSTHCYPPQDYSGVLDVSQDADSAPTGLAVQTHGNVLAVAHGRKGIVRLFNKESGAFLSSFNIPVSADASNQLAISANGDLWVIAGATAVRYARLESVPMVAASINGLSHPLAVATDPNNDDIVLIADGGSSQQVKAFDRTGRSLWTYGDAGGNANDPRVSATSLWFYFDSTSERSALAVSPDGSFWIVDTCNDRMLHIGRDRSYIEQIAYVPASYSATVDADQPSRIFSNYLEFDVRPGEPLVPGPKVHWTLVRNWLAALPSAARTAPARNGGFTGLQTVVTLRNRRTYALTAVQHEQVLLELPRLGPARIVKTLTAPNGADTPTVLYENGDLGYASTRNGLQTVYRQAVAGFDRGGDPIWESRPHILASVASGADVPTYKGVFSGATGPRFPITSSNRVVFFDQSIATDKASPTGHHLGALDVGGTVWVWKASPSGTIEQPGAFPTKAVDRTVDYGGNMLWAVGRHVVYGYHGEGFTDPVNGKIGEANQFMHFYDDGLFVGQFGVPTTRATINAAAGVAGNSFSNILVGGSDGATLLFFHNDESQHAGVHRWTIGNLSSVRELSATGAPGGTLMLH